MQCNSVAPPIPPTTTPPHQGKNQKGEKEGKRGDIKQINEKLILVQLSKELQNFRT
jgi:hypothetical protein